MSHKTSYAGARGFRGDALYNTTLGDILSKGERSTGVISNMWHGAAGARQAALQGATAAYDWRTVTATAPLRKTKEKQKKQGPVGNPMPNSPYPLNVAKPGNPPQGGTTLRAGHQPQGIGPAPGSTGMAVPSNHHFVYNVNGMAGPTIPAADLGGDHRTALPPGSQFKGTTGTWIQPQTSLGWNRGNVAIANYAASGPAVGAGPQPAALNAGPKQRRKAGMAPSALGRIQQERGGGGWPG